MNERGVKRSPLLLLPACLLAACCLAGCGPFIIIPGGALDGSPAPVPQDWSFTDTVDTVQIETNPDDPYSVNVWGIGDGDVFYIAGSQDSTWVENLKADPEVRLRVEGKLYELRATPTESQAEIDEYVAAIEKKYDYELDPEDRSGAQLFRLTPR